MGRSEGRGPTGDKPKTANLRGIVRGPTPAWTKVPQTQLSADPFRNLCQIRTPSRRGSGWLSTNGHVYTAAHVVFGHAGCEVRFAGSPTWIPAQSIRIHPGYVGGNGEARKGSSADLARIELPPGATTLPGLQTDAYAAGAVSAKGYPGDDLVQHSGNAMRWEAFICHHADTLSGHSGCPVMVGNRVVGIHVGPASLVRQYFSSPNPQTNPFINGAVMFGPAQISSLAQP